MHVHPWDLSIICFAEEGPGEDLAGQKVAEESTMFPCSKEGPPHTGVLSKG